MQTERHLMAFTPGEVPSDQPPRDPSIAEIAAIDHQRTAAVLASPEVLEAAVAAAERIGVRMTAGEFTKRIGALLELGDRAIQEFVDGHDKLIT